jgi:sodium-dependent dicarboxylate transporter 2/3/5
MLALLGGLLLLNSRIEPWYPGLGMDDKMIMLGFGLLMFVPGMNFLSWEDTRRIPYEIIFLFGAGFSIAGALVDSGLAQVIAQSLEAFAQFHAFFLILVIAALITFSTEITSNTALVSLAVPIIYSLGQLAETSTVLILMVAAICGSYAFMLPIATPPNAIAMSSGALRVKEMMTLGLVFNLLGRYPGAFVSRSCGNVYSSFCVC